MVDGLGVRVNVSNGLSLGRVERRDILVYTPLYPGGHTTPGYMLYYATLGTPLSLSKVRPVMLHGMRLGRGTGARPPTCRTEHS